MVVVGASVVALCAPAGLASSAVRAASVNASAVAEAAARARLAIGERPDGVAGVVGVVGRGMVIRSCP
jgi:hypothetical protein